MTMKDVTEDQKKMLRKVKGVPGELQDVARNTLVTGCIVQGAYMQFGTDMSVYNLWEALLFAHDYEKNGDYAPGTVDKTIEAVLKAAKKIAV